MKRTPSLIFAVLLLILEPNLAGRLHAAENESSTQAVHCTVDFQTVHQEWDGFGVNYVQMAQSADPVNDPQDYGGFSELKEKKRWEILQLIFGSDGLRPGIIKMFLDPFHQAGPDEEFDHESNTSWMRYFARNGVEITRKRGGPEIQIITTLYGPPAWATSQQFLRGRDLDPAQFENLADYMIDWTKFLIEEELLPVRFISLHNEGDAPYRWPVDGNSGNMDRGHDYNAFWRPQQVARFLEFMPSQINAAGLDVGLTPGETTYWRNLALNMYSWAIHDNTKALANMALITSHGFGTGNAFQTRGVDFLRTFRPELHAWTTSASWGRAGKTTDIEFLNLFRRNIYEAKVNAIIPWAIVKTSDWKGGDPNSSSALFINDDGNLEIRPQYYYYKQLSVAGQPGMNVATVNVDTGSDIELIAFASGGTANPDAFLVINLGKSDRNVAIEVNGEHNFYAAIRSSEGERYLPVGNFTLADGMIGYWAPAESVTTFFAQPVD
jgi:O-glycosyl hydrolase